MEEVKVHDLVFCKYISSNEITQRVKQLSAEINIRFEGKLPIILPVLNGSFFFGSDICKHLEIPYEISFVKIASYKGLEQSGNTQTLIGLDESLSHRDIIIIEDIIDSGLTIHNLLKNLESFHPNSVTICTLTLKREALKYNFPIDLIGFEVENKFLVGYGLDYDKQGRHLKDIYKLKEDNNND